MPVKKKTSWFLGIASLSTFLGVVGLVLPDTSNWLSQTAVPWLANPPQKLSIILLVLGLVIAYLAIRWHEEHTWAVALRDEGNRRPTAAAHAIVEAELADLKLRSHRDDQTYLNRMISDRARWTWLETFHGWFWKRDDLIGLRDLWHSYKEWEFRDPELEAARSSFLASIDTFFRRATDERDELEAPQYDPEGEIEHWEGRIRAESARQGGATEYEAVKEELSDLSGDVLSSWRDLLKVARSRPELSVETG